ncbi:hypothetical protein FH972_014210 [Carpinus fangiana]|uniref:Uncharacterized protein n=1 Tax=Carpinus fangiana TaxID=176857 RepID=A0A5N6RC92_9ROSI|nr:hypothetical protein FH972_014210 [Carpinus fangiana]
MFVNANIISCNFSTSPSLTLNLKDPELKKSLQSHNLKPRIPFLKETSKFSAFLKPQNHRSSTLAFQKKGLAQICHFSLTRQKSEDPVVEKRDPLEGGVGGNGRNGGNGGNGGEGRDWTTSILLLVLWGALLYYVFNLSPNQTPSRDMYFLKKLLNLKGDDGFRMNAVLVSLWYIMGLWPLVYSMLLLPTGRSSKSKVPLWPFLISSKSKVPVWPFLILSFFGGAYALLPYFVLWTPPPPPVEETEIKRWPLNFLETKLTAAISLAAGLGILVYAGLANWDDWKEFYQYFRESKFVSVGNHW